MDLEYLKKAEADLTLLLERTLTTYSDLESKAKYLATAFVAFLTALSSYAFANFETDDLWQQLILLGLIPPFIYCFYQIIHALRARDYKDGIYLESPERRQNQKDYLSDRIANLPSTIKKNAEQNDKKAGAINNAFMGLILSVPIALGCGLLFATLAANFDNFGVCFAFAGAAAVSAVFTIVVARHIIPRMLESSEGVSSSTP